MVSWKLVHSCSAAGTGLTLVVFGRGLHAATADAPGHCKTSACLPQQGGFKRPDKISGRHAPAQLTPLGLPTPASSCCCCRLHFCVSTLRELCCATPQAVPQDCCCCCCSRHSWFSTLIPGCGSTPEHAARSPVHRSKTQSQEGSTQTKRQSSNQPDDARNGSHGSTCLDGSVC